MPAAITITDLKKIYRPGAKDAVTALDGVSFEVAPGSIFGLLGPNGAGKSTLVKILTTITTPSSGRAAVAGFDVIEKSLEARRKMAVVLQQTAAETLLNVQDNLLIYASLHGLGRQEALKRARAVAEEFDLESKLREVVQDLSIGTKRRIQVAKVFMLDAPIIVMDEATTGMDPLMKRRVMDRIRAEAKKGRTVLLTTQVLTEAEELCDRIVIIHRGRTLASGTLADLRRLSRRMFRVALTFSDAVATARIERCLQALEPVELTVEGAKAELLFQGEETSLLGRLADVSREAPITQFEVRGPDLEEIFLTLLRDAR